jgi:ATP-dependent helicase/nuclease subunit B
MMSGDVAAKAGQRRVQLKVYTIAAERPFLRTLAAELLKISGSDPLQLPRATVLLPTRRAVRGLREAFLRITGEEGAVGIPLLLPRMRPIGDLDADELALLDGVAEEDGLSVAPAIPELRRRLLLTRLVLRWGERRGQAPLLPGQAAALAGSLARLLDSVETDGASFRGLDDLAPENLAEHWRIVVRFLEILPHHWPGILAAEGAIDPAERRNRLLERQADRWRRSPPRDPVIAAGLVGGVPAITELLSVVASLDRGAVILPGLDRACDRAEWQAIEEDASHPQHLMAGLLKALGIDPREVREWPDTHPSCRTDRHEFESVGDLPLFAAVSSTRDEMPRSRRVRLVGEVLRPANVTDAWRRLTPLPAAAVDGLSRYDCSSAQQEAVTIALLLRRKLETPGATAALVTPDRDLARRVAAELRRWNIEIDDSAGLALNRTPPGVFLRLVLDLAASQAAPVALLAALKHPLAAGGLAPVAFRDLARRLEQAILGPRPAPGFAGLRAALARSSPDLRRYADRLEACLGTLPGLLAANAAPLSQLVASHIEAAERLAATATETGSERLWRDAAGEVAARFCHELIEAARDFPPLPGRHYPALFEALLAGPVVRPAYGRHPRLAVWGLLEARLQQPDLFVLGGLNEGTWPGAADYDPWMSRQMRRQFGIASPERAIGVAAHDFAQAIGAPEVALTRAARSEGVPTVPSRWLLRLDAVLRAVGLGDALRPDDTVRRAVELIDQAKYHPLPSAEPRPPLAARPRKLSVTQIETWLRDPYAIYARHVLGLKALDELDADPGRAELGTAVHRALDEFARRFPKGLPEEAEAELLQIGFEQFGPFLSRPGAWAFWWPRFVRIAGWLVAEERAHRPGVVESISECLGSWTFEACGGPFTMTAKADRLDRLASGGFLLVDYKTGALPSTKEVQAGFAPQLPLEGAILQHGGFGEVRGSAVALEYWRLSGARPPGERCPVGAADTAALIQRVLSRVRALVERFDDPSTPYLAVPSPRWAPRFSDYRHLERLAETEAE